MKKIIILVFLMGFVFGCCTAVKSKNIGVENGLKTIVVVLSQSKDGGGKCAGVVLNKSKGLIATAAHCANQIDSMDVIAINGRSPSKIAYIDTKIDLAFLVVSDKNILRNMKNAAFTDDINLGDHLYLIGHPDDSFYSVSGGIISQILVLNETGLGLCYPAIKTDALGRPGNSGGAAFNSNWEFIGLASTIDNPPGTGYTFLVDARLIKILSEKITTPLD